MPVNATMTPPERVEALHRAHAAISGERVGPAVQNVPTVLALTDPDRLPWRGQMWEVPPIGFKLGAELMRVGAELGQIGEAMKAAAATGDPLMI